MIGFFSMGENEKKQFWLELDLSMTAEYILV